MEEEIPVGVPIIIDSCLWIEIIRGTSLGKEVEKYLDKEYDVLVSAISIAEVYHYMLKNKMEEEARRTIEFIQKRCFIIPVTHEISIKSAELRINHSLGMADSIIYYSGIVNNAILLTCDYDFKDLESVRYIKK